jgi:hypothetical protein
VEYPIFNEDKRQALKLDGDETKEDKVLKIVSIISEYTTININKLNYFVSEFGIDILNKPDVIGVTKEQKEKLENIKTLLDGIVNAV